jgi:hypothetical protein
MTKLFKNISTLNELKNEFDIISNKQFSEKYFSHEFLIGDPACIEFLTEIRQEFENERKG